MRCSAPWPGTEYSPQLFNQSSSVSHALTERPTPLPPFTPFPNFQGTEKYFYTFSLGDFVLYIFVFNLKCSSLCEDTIFMQPFPVGWLFSHSHVLEIQDSHYYCQTFLIKSLTPNSLKVCALYHSG